MMIVMGTCSAVLYSDSWTVLSSEQISSSWISFSLVVSKCLLVSSSLKNVTPVIKRSPSAGFKSSSPPNQSRF